jgi:hypothetical protein
MSSVTDGAWAPDGSRVASVDDKGQIVTSLPDGAWPFVVAPAKAGATRSHPTWFAGGTAIVFTEVVGGKSDLVAVDAYTPSGKTPVEGRPYSYLPTNWQEGTESSPDSNGKSIVFQHVDAATNTPQVWIQDGFGRASATDALIADGTDPSISPDGSKVAYLQKDANGDEQIWLVGWDGTNQKVSTAPVQITHDAHGHLRPTWSPDGTRIAFENTAPGGGAAIDVQSVDAAGNNQKQEFATPGVPAYQPLVKDKVVRLAGGDRLATAIAASQANWPTAGTAPNSQHAQAVVLSRSDQFADALGGATLAGYQGPLLLTQTDHLDAGVKAEITRVLGPVNAQDPQTVYVLGGEQALSPAVFNTVHAMGYKVQRVWGNDRYSTSVAIAKQVASNGPTSILVATGRNFPDALSAGAAANSGSGAGYRAGVVLLTDDKAIPASTAAYLAQSITSTNKPAVYGIGGQADTALTNAGIAHTSVAGSDRYQTSYMVARTFFDSWDGTAPHEAGFATAVTWPDALSGGAFMASHRSPLLLVNPVTGASTDEEAWLSGWSSSISTGDVFGGTAAVNNSAVTGPTGVVGLYDGPAGVDFVTNPHA